MPASPRPRLARSLDPLLVRTRDARQVAELDAFFRGTRGAGPVGIAPWIWQSVIGRPGAIAFELGAPVTHERADRLPSVLAFAKTFAASIFAREPACFFVVETTAAELPFPLPVDADGYAHHAVIHGGRRFFVSNPVISGRIFPAPKRGMLENVYVLEQAAEDEPSMLRGFLHRRARAGRAPLTAKLAAALAKRGPFRAGAAETRRLVAGGLPKDHAASLWSGELLGWRGSLGVMDWERVVALSDAAAGDDPGSLWDAPRAKGGPIDRAIAAYPETAAIDRAIAELQTGSRGALRVTTAKRSLVPTSGKLSATARKKLAAALGLPASEDPRTLAQETQQVRWDGGSAAFARVLGAAQRGLAPSEARGLLDFVYQHQEHSH